MSALVLLALLAADGGTVTVTGSLDKEEIRRVIVSHRAETKACYEAHPDAAGKLTVEFVIGPDGRVASADIGTSTGPQAELSACLRKAVLGFVFPKPKGGGTVRVAYPWTFK